MGGAERAPRCGLSILPADWWEGGILTQTVGAILSSEWKDALWHNLFTGRAPHPEAIRRAVRHSEESLRALAKRYGIDQRTVAKWKKRETIVDLPNGPKSLSIEFRQHLARVRAYAMTCNEAWIVSVPLYIKPRLWPDAEPMLEAFML